MTTDRTPAKLRKLAEAATPGPWMHYRDKLRPQFSGRVNEVQASTRPAVVRWSGFDDSARPEKQHAANAAYIAAFSPDVALDLLAQLAEQRSINAALRLRSSIMATTTIHGAHCYDGATLICGWPAEHVPMRGAARRETITFALGRTADCGECGAPPGEAHGDECPLAPLEQLPDSDPNIATEWRTQVAKEAVERFQKAVDLLDMAIDDTHPEGCECDICHAADALDDLLSEGTAQ